MPRANTNPGSLSLAPAQCQDALHRVLQSHTFARSEKLQRFLKYVSRMTLDGDGGLLNEHLIAIDVFERGDDYSPGEDSVVRRQAHALRRKLKEYYDAEGQADAIRIEVPVGTYVPVFHEKPDTPSAAVAPPPPAAQIAATPAIREWHPAWKPTASGALIALVAGAVFWGGWAAGRAVYVPAAASSVTASEIGEIWGPWLSDKSGVMLCFSNPTVATVRQFPGPLVPNPEHQGIPVDPEQDAAFRRFFRMPEGGNLYLYPVMAQAKLGEAMAAVALTRFLSRSGVTVSSTESRFLAWPTLRQENVILFGHADSNQWIEPILRSAPLTVAPTDREHRARILNPHPQPGEEPDYYPNIPDATRSYALVSMLAGVDGNHRVLVISGLDNSSTAAAAEFLIRQESAALLRRLRTVAPSHHGPWHFQVVLETDVRDAVALKAVPIVVRVL
jgi:hypothetical protein